MTRAISIFLASAFVFGCSSLDPVAVSSSDVGIEEGLIFSSDFQAVVAATKDSFKEKKWKLLYEGETLPDKNYSHFSNMSHNPFNPSEAANYDQIAIDMVLEPGVAPSYYLQAKTPTSAFSYGAELFVVVYEGESGGSAIRISASSGQALEKKKLGTYIEELAGSIQSRAN